MVRGRYNVGGWIIILLGGGGLLNYLPDTKLALVGVVCCMRGMARLGIRSRGRHLSHKLFLQGIRNGV